MKGVQRAGARLRAPGRRPALRTRSTARARAASRASSARATRWRALEAALGRAIAGSGRSSASSPTRGSGRAGSASSSPSAAGRAASPSTRRTASPHGKAHSVPARSWSSSARYFGITEQDSEQAAREKIAGTDAAPRRVASRCAAAPVRLSRACPIPSSRRRGWIPRRGSASSSRSSSAWCRRAAAASRRSSSSRTCTGSTAASEAFLEVLVEATTATRTLSLVNFRPEYHADWMQKSYYQQLPLLPLEPEAIGELLARPPGRRSLAGRLRRAHPGADGRESVLHRGGRAGAGRGGSLVGTRGAYRLVRPLDERRHSGHGPGRARRADRSAGGAGEAGPADGRGDRKGVHGAGSAARRGATRDRARGSRSRSSRLRSSSTSRRSTRKRSTPSSTR